MKKRVFIIHGWDSHPEEEWFPWLKNQLEEKGFEVFVPQMPDTENPVIEKWIPTISKTVGIAGENTYFVGHSIGAQAIIRYLESQPESIKIGGAVFVAGWFTLKNLESEEEWETAKPWLETLINFEKVKIHLPKSVAIFSDNDPYVPLDNQNVFRDKLSSEIIIEHNKGHFIGDDDGITELPIVLEKIIGLSECSL